MKHCSSSKLVQDGITSHAVVCLLSNYSLLIPSLVLMINHLNNLCKWSSSWFTGPENFILLGLVVDDLCLYMCNRKIGATMFSQHTFIYDLSDYFGFDRIYMGHY